MSDQFPISVSLPVFKALTSRLDEGVSYDDVLRDLLKLDSPVEPESEIDKLTAMLDDKTGRLGYSFSGGQGFYSRGLILPNDTNLKARYKNRNYVAKIINNEWVNDDGSRHSSPSAAAGAITGTNVNGLSFWQAQLPGERAWRRLSGIRKV